MQLRTSRTDLVHSLWALYLALAVVMGGVLERVAPWWLL